MNSSAPKIDNAKYYDQFSDWYERERHHGYHALIDDLQTDLILPACHKNDVLELGCGTGLILRRVVPVAQSAKGIDISEGMLEKARERGLDVKQGDVTELPYEDESFDTIYSFKVLSHVKDIQKTFSECARVTRPGGRLFLEFYNRHSLRYAVKRATRPGAISDDVNESEVFTRWYTLDELTAMLPPDLKHIGTSGVRVVTPAAVAHRVPLLRTLLRNAEYKLRDSETFAPYGGFLVLILQKQ